MGNDFKSESHGYVARIEDHTNNVDDGSVRKRGKEREGERVRKSLIKLQQKD